LVPVLAHVPYLRSVVPANPSATMSLARDLKHWRPDVAHLHGYGYAFIDLAGLLLRRDGIRYVFTIHGVPQTPRKRGFITRSAYAAYVAVGASRTANGSAAITAVSRAVAAEFGGRRSITVVPNGIAPLPPSSDTGVRQLSASLGLEPGVPILAAAGRLSVSKGFDRLVGALAHIDRDRVACVIAGADGGELGNLRRQAAALPKNIRLVLPGWLDRQRLSDLFSLADVVVIPSRDEPFGLVGLEALGKGRRVVASRIGGLQEFLAPPAADLVDGDDGRAWAVAISAALSRGPFTAMDHKVADEILAEHAWSRVAKRYEQLMDSVRG